MFLTLRTKSSMLGSMKNAKEHTATRAGISRRHLDYLLAAERNASPLMARRLEKATGIARERWVFGTPAQRQAAWKKFQKDFSMDGLG